MKTIFRLVGIAALSALMYGCAHPITLAPNLAEVKLPAQAKQIDKSVGYYISDADKAKEVTTPGGGGDKVRYFPYRDMEAGIYKALSEAFKSVTKLASLTDADSIAKNKITFVITPEITTNSSSPSPFTWPPTVFTLNLNCTVKNSTGANIANLKVTGEGKAEFEEFKKDFSLSAKRASDDALQKLLIAISQSPELQK